MAYQNNSEFFIRLLLSILATFLVLKFVGDYSSNRVHSLKRLAYFAIALFVLSFLSSWGGWLKPILEFDPALPLWLPLEILRLGFLWALAARSATQQVVELKKLQIWLLRIIAGASVVVMSGLFLPASFFTGPEKLDSNGVVMQTLQVTCVPSALANVCRLYGEQMTEYEATARAKTLFIGSLVSHSIYACHRLGFSEAAFSNKTFKHLIEENLPFIITVGSGFNQVEHAIAIVGCNEKKIFLADPLRGLIVLNHDQVEKIDILSIIRLGKRKGFARAPTLTSFDSIEDGLK
ncbi:MAG: cysteine peptidase family C39 domain-containing protein [Candidatus Riflebacteria bacterium]